MRPRLPKRRSPSPTSACPPTARAHLAQSVTAWAYLDLHGAIEHLDRAIAHANAAGDAYSHLAAAVRRALTLLWLGDVQEADEAGASALAVGEQHNLVFGMVYALAARAGAACFSGRSDEAAAFADEVVLRQRLGDYAWGLTFSPTDVRSDPRRSRTARTRRTQCWSASPTFRDENPAGYPWGGYTDVFDVAVQLITDPDARTTEITVPSWLATTQISGALGWSGIAAAVAEIAWWKRDPVLAENARLGLKWCDESDMGVVDGWLASVPRTLGIATAAGGDHEEGRRLIARGRDWARHQHADLEHSLCGWWECEITRFDGVQAPQTPSSRHARARCREAMLQRLGHRGPGHVLRRIRGRKGPRSAEAVPLQGRTPEMGVR